MKTAVVTAHVILSPGVNANSFFIPHLELKTAVVTAHVILRPGPGVNANSFFIPHLELKTAVVTAHVILRPGVNANSFVVPHRLNFISQHGKWKWKLSTSEDERY